MPRTAKPKNRTRKPQQLSWGSKVRCNPLLAKPPQGVHGLEVAGGSFFRQHVGRATTPEDYYGVHTTGSKAISMIYATGTVSAHGGFPVILQLNTSGLHALTDVDALAQAAFLLKDNTLRRSYADTDLQEACEMDGEGSDIRDGMDVALAFMNVFESSRFCAAFADDEEAWTRWLRTGEYSDEIASNLVDQRRFMTDFDLDRLISIEGAKPWWPYVVVDDPYTDEEQHREKLIEDAGYKTISYDDIFHDHMVTSKLIAKGLSGSTRTTQYHGTSSTFAERAFPSLGALDNPFPTAHSIDEVEDLLRAEGISPNPKPRARAHNRKATNVRDLVRRALK